MDDAQMWPLLLRSQVGGLCFMSTANWAPHSDPQSQMQEQVTAAGFFPQGLSWPWEIILEEKGR